MLHIDGLHLAHGPLSVVRDLDLSLMPGQVTAVFGPNGAGKSTLLRGLFGEHVPRAGSLRLDELTFRPTLRRAWQDRIGYMPQEGHASAGLTALEVVLLGSIEHLSLRLSRVALREAAETLERLGLLALADRRIETLSGGQKQLVYFAQVLARKPRLLLLDEPVSALDLRHQMLLLGRVRALTAEQRIVTVIVLHDLNLAAAFADRAILLHDGGAAADGTPAQVFTPARLRAVYGVEAEVRHTEAGQPWIRVLGAQEGRDAVL